MARPHCLLMATYISTVGREGALLVNQLSLCFSNLALNAPLGYKLQGIFLNLEKYSLKDLLPKKKILTNVEEVPDTAKSAQHMSSDTLIPSAMFPSDFAEIEVPIGALHHGRIPVVFLPYRFGLGIRVYVALERHRHTFSDRESESGFSGYGERRCIWK